MKTRAEYMEDAEGYLDLAAETTEPIDRRWLNNQAAVVYTRIAEAYIKLAELAKSDVDGAA